MTLPKGFGSGGGGGAGSADVEKMIGRRVENMTGIYHTFFHCSMASYVRRYCSRIHLLSMGLPHT